MNLLRPKIAIRLFVLFASLFFAGAVLAETIRNPIGASSFTEIIESIADFAVLIITPLSVLVILYAAVLFMFSAGNVEKVTKARRAFVWALVGLAIVLTGRGIIYIVSDVLSGGRLGPGF